MYIMFIMKYFFFLALVFFMGTFVGCEDSGVDKGPEASETGKSPEIIDDDANVEDEGTHQGSFLNSEGKVDVERVVAYAKNVADTLPAIFLKDYESKNVVAWYKAKAQIDYVHDTTKVFVYALYLFDDGSFVMTKNQVELRPEDITYSRLRDDSGTWTISDGGEFGNGTVTLNLRSLYLELPIEMGTFIYGWQDIVFTLMNEPSPAPCEELTSHSD